MPDASHGAPLASSPPPPPGSPPRPLRLAQRVPPRIVLAGLAVLILALVFAQLSYTARLESAAAIPATVRSLAQFSWALTALAVLAALVSVLAVLHYRRRDQALHADLEQRVAERTAELAAEISARRAAESELRGAQGRLHLALAAANTCTWDSDPATGRVLLDARWSAMLGGPLVETSTTARALITLAHQDDRRPIADIVQRCIAGAADEYAVEHRVRRRDGTWLWIDSRGRVVGRDASRRALRIIGTNTDISARKRAEDAVQRQMLFLAALNETTLDLLDRRAEGELLQAIVGRMAALLRAQQVELTLIDGEHLVVRALTGRPLAAVGDRRSRQAAPLPWRAVDRRAPTVIDDYANDPDASPVYRGRGYHSGVMLPIVHGDRCLGVFGILRDQPGQPFTAEEVGQGTSLTNLVALVLHNATVYHDAVRVAEARTQELREKEERFRAVFNQSPIPIIVTTVAEARIIEVNDAAYSVFGFAREETVGKSTAELGLWPNLAQRDEYFRQLRERGTVHGLEATMRTKHGDILDVLCTGTVLKIGERPLILSSAIDITARKHAEAERSALERSLRQSQKMESLGTLAGGVAHDFNNVLTGVIGFTELARHELPAGQPAIPWLNQVLATSQRARDLVRQILTFSRRNEGERHAQRLQPVIEEALRLLRSALPAMVELRPSISPLAPPAVVDATQIHQILMNLCTNAWHALPDSRGRIIVSLDAFTVTRAHVDARHDLPLGPCVRLTVSDNGTGMTPAVAERIFEPFFTTKEVGKGSGLGLSVVHGIMESHGGAIVLHTTPGVGTTFELYFPAVQVTLPAPPPPARSTSTRGHGERILLVDDDPDSGLALEKLSESFGYQVRRFIRPVEMLAHFRTAPHACDAAILDLAMPVMPGDVLARELLRVRPDLPILVLSGLVEPARQQALEKAGVRAVLRKPPDSDELARHLAALVGSPAAPVVAR